MRYLTFLFILIFLSACSLKQEGSSPAPLAQKELEKHCPKLKECPVCEKQKPCKPKNIIKAYERPVLGEIEEVYLPVHALFLKARIDTGATTNSIHAENIVPFERDGEKWVRFDLKGSKGKKVQIKRPIVKMIRVKRHGEEGQERYVVNLRLNISSLSNFSQVSLTDRGKYSYPVLIGRNYLKGNALVDVSKQYTRAPIQDKK